MSSPGFLHSLPVIAVLAMPLLPSAMPQAAMPTGVVTLADLRDRARPLLIFAPTADDPRLTLQLRILAEDREAVADRDLLPLAVTPNTPTAASLSAPEAQAARQRFHVAPNTFVVLLLGKDGGEKLRSPAPLSLRQLSDTIDAMPMRQQEMKAERSFQPD